MTNWFGGRSVQARRVGEGRRAKAGVALLAGAATVSLAVYGVGPAAQAQPAAHPGGADRVAQHGGPPGSLAAALTRDGSLKATSGSYSTRGYDMVLSPNGAPRFVPASSGGAASASSQWSESFGGVGASNSVQAVAVSGANVYIGMGITTTFGGVNYNHVARWDGKGWHTMSKGLNGYVNGLAALGSDVFAVGTFTQLGDGTPASHVAMWNGTTWSALGSGLTTSPSGTGTYLNAVAAAGTPTSPQVYVGGEFDTAGGNPALNVAEWNGTQWSALGAGLTNYTVNALATDGTTLYAGGSFTGSGTTKLDSLAQWDGTSWSGVGGAGVASSFGYNGKVTSLALSAGQLYVSGSFGMVGGTFSSGLQTGGVSAQNVAEWNGSSWAALAGGLPNGARALGVWKGILYAGGGFGNQGSMSTIQAWNGTAWGSAGTGLACCGVNAIAVATAGVVAGGSFTGDYSGAVLLNNIGQWNGTKWNGFGLGTNAAVTAMAGSGTTLYAAGGFTAAGSLVVNSIARFSANKWSSLGSGANAGSGGYCGVSDTLVGICTLTIDPATGDLYVGGSFTAINGVAANNVAVWNGTAWQALGGGTDGLVNALAIMDGVLYAGGRFGHADGNAADDLAEWPLTGGPWSPLPGDPAVTPGSGNAWQVDVNSLTPITTVFADHYLAIGGGYLDFTGTPVGGLVFYDATAATSSSYYYYPPDTGTTPGVGVNGSILTTLVDGTDLYVGGTFQIAGGHTASNIAVLHFAGSTGNYWGTPGQVTGSEVSSIVMAGTSLYVGGAFTAVSGVAAANVIRYTPGAGTPWSKLSSGVGTSGDVLNALWQGSAGLYAGGRFGTAGGRPSTNIGLWPGTAGL